MIRATAGCLRFRREDHWARGVRLLVSYAGGCLCNVAHLTQHLAPHTLHLTPHTSHLTPHTSHTTPRTSHTTPHTPLPSGHGYSASSTDAPNTANSNPKNYHATFLTSKDMDRPPAPASAPRCKPPPAAPLPPPHTLTKQRLQFISRFPFNTENHLFSKCTMQRALTLPAGPTHPRVAAAPPLQEQAAGRSTLETPAACDAAAYKYA
jgi:hypothetical protein